MLSGLQADLNSIVGSVVAVSLAANGFFLRGVARRIDIIDERQRKHGDRLTWLEAHAGTHYPRRRQHDSDTYEPEENNERSRK